jgi:hypothetical protein
MPTARPPIPLPLPDYQRIFRVLKSVYDGGAINTVQPSLFFSVAGAHLIAQFYKKRCQPVVGAAFYKMDDRAETVLTLADKEASNETLSSTNGFHCWAFCDGYIIDFMAPLFRELLQEQGVAAHCARKMFQKPLASMADSPLLMHAPGDFYLLPNVDLTREILEEFVANQENMHAVKACELWFKKPPREIPRQVSIAASDGTPTPMALSDLSLTGVW